MKKNEYTIYSERVLKKFYVFKLNDKMTSTFLHVKVKRNVTEITRVYKKIVHVNAEETNSDIEPKPKETVPCFGLHATMNKSDSSNDSSQLSEKPETRNQTQLLQDILPENFSQSGQLKSQILLSIHSSDQQNPFMQASYSNMGTNNLIKNSVQLQNSHERECSLAQQQGMILENTLNVPSKSSEESLEGIAAGTQKTAEKMRRDEELGTMATISAVLYSNTQHPELKQTYPNWNDRCKQILKRWRSLSTEKKAPFLQQAKDNRSALRMRRTQQEQERINIQHKVLKEQEQERIWKLHQAKVKEVPVSGFKNDANKFKENGMQTTVMYTLNNVGNSGTTQTIGQDDKNPNTHISSNIAPSTESSIFKIQQNNPNVEILRDKVEQTEVLKTYRLPINVDKGNEHLRTLLQKQTTATPCAPRKKINVNVVPMSEHNEQLQYKNEGMEACTLQPKHISTSTLCKNSINQGPDTLKNQEQCTSENSRPRIMAKFTECSESSAVNELEKIDQDAENAGFGDILGGFGEGDDDDLLKSLTAEIGDDFNILEYADPELDALANNQNLLSKLDFDDGTHNN